MQRAHDALQLVRTCGAIDADGVNAQRLQNLRRFEDRAVKVAFAVGLDRKCAEDRDIAERTDCFDGGDVVSTVSYF